MKREKVSHGFGPVYNEESRILILGSFPSVKSRQEAFYYAHPQNRFWKVLEAITGSEVPKSVDGKREFLLFHRIAVYDVIEECSIIGSSDSSIEDVVPADISEILENSSVESRIYCNGGKSFDLYCRYLLPEVGIEATKLPSTSSANAAYSLDRLVEIWNKTLVQIGRMP